MGEHAPPEPPSPYAEEGTRAHALLERCIVEARYPRDDEGDDAQMREAVTEAADYVFSRGMGAFFVLAERRLKMPYGDDEYGTADVTILDDAGVLEVIDFKYGQGVWVPVIHNPQLAAYMGAAALALAHEGKTATAYKATIIQPRAGGQTLRSWDLGRADLDGEVGDLHRGWQLARAFDRVPLDTLLTQLVPGEAQCRFCPARVFCPARRDLALRTVAQDFHGVTISSFEDVRETALPEPLRLNPREISEILVAAPLIRNWLKAVEQAALGDARAGRLIPGMKLVQAEAKREYLHDDAGLNALMLSSLTGGAMAPDDFLRDRPVVPITEAEKLLKAWASANADKGEKRKAAQRIVDSMADMLDKRSSGNLQLVPESDPRPAVNPARDFAGVSVQTTE